MMRKIRLISLFLLFPVSAFAGRIYDTTVPDPLTVTSPAFVTYTNILGRVPSDGYRLNQFFLALSSAGLLNNLVDGCFLRTTQNLDTGTSLLTIRGASTTIVGSPPIGVNGVFTNGSSQYMYWTISNTTASSVAVTYKGVISGQTSFGNIASLHNNKGIGTGAASDTGGYRFLFNGTATGYAFTGQNASVAVTSSILDPVSSSASTIHYNNPYEQIDIVTNDNASSPALTAYVDGKLCMNDASGNVQTTSSRNEFMIGATRYNAGGGGVQGYGRGTFTNWFVFDKVLSSAEALALSDAMRWLNPAKKNLVFVGDSTSAFLIAKASDSWSYQYSILKNNSDYRIYNVAVNGQDTAFFNTNYTNFIGRYGAGKNGVDESLAINWLGINDINNGGSDSTLYTRLKTLWESERKSGFRVHVMTLMPGTGFTGNKETYRLAIATSILSDPGLYDSVYRPDLFFPDPNDTTIYLDTFHLLPEANRQLANIVNANQSEVNIRPNTYPLTDAATIATNCALIPKDAILTVTLGGSRTLGNPTNPTNGRRLIYRLLQDGTGTRLLTLGTKFSSGPFTVVLTVTANKADYLEAVYNLANDKWEIVNFQKGY